MVQLETNVHKSDPLAISWWVFPLPFLYLLAFTGTAKGPWHHQGAVLDKKKKENFTFIQLQLNNISVKAHNVLVKLLPVRSSFLWTPIALLTRTGNNNTWPKGRLHCDLVAQYVQHALSGISTDASSLTSLPIYPASHWVLDKR